jgi:DMSO reductase family type II enzyme heme b subunit
MMIAGIVFSALIGLAGVAHAGFDIENGKKVYAKRCEQCHGVDGAADGPAAPFMYPRPRVFKDSSVYKFAVTPDGAIPTEQDMYKVIDQGIPGTSMPAFPVLSDSDKRDLVGLLRSWSEDFADSDYTEDMVPMAELDCPPIPTSAESVARGKKVYEANMCSDCHGVAGRGDGPNWSTLATDSWGNTMVPRNLNNPETFRNGHTPADMLKSISRGLTGSPMASYRDAIVIEDRWHLINYIRSHWPELKKSPDEAIVAVRVADLPSKADDKAWRDAPTARFATLAQIIEPPRLYFQSVEYINAQAVYSDQGIAMRITWDDRSNSKGKDLKTKYRDRDTTVYRDTKHPDQFAVQFAAKADKDGARPYFLLGDSKRAVNTWWWRSDKGQIEEINVKGFGAFMTQKAENTQVEGAVTYEDGQYTMVVQRSLKTSDKGDVQFAAGDWVPIAFNAWDGSRGEVGQRRAVSTWYFVFLEPEIPAQAHVLPPALFLVTLGVLGLLIRSTRQGHLVETGQQDAKAPLFSDAPDAGMGRIGIVIGVVGILCVGPLIYGISKADDPVHTQIKNHQAVAAATTGFTKDADAESLRAALVTAGVPNTLAKAPDLSGAHLTLVGGMPAPGERAGAAFRYKDGDELWVLQAVTHLPGGGQSHHTRHVGHTVLRGYEGKGISAVLWQDGGATYLFSGPGKVSHVLDQTQLAVFGVSAGGSDH